LTGFDQIQLQIVTVLKNTKRNPANSSRCDTRQHMRHQESRQHMRHRTIGNAQKLKKYIFRS